MTQRAAVRPMDLWILLISNVRYSMHRRSTAPSTCQDLLRTYARHLTAQQRAQIADEIEAELRMGEVGAPCDTRTWHETVAYVRAMDAEAPA